MRSFVVGCCGMMLGVVFAVQGAQGSVPHSGQTRCYDDSKEIPCPAPGEPFYGQDGNYAHLRPPRYVKLDGQGNVLDENTTDGWVAVRDEVTGLVWQVRWPASEMPDDLFDIGRVYDWCQKDASGNMVGSCPDSTYAIRNTAEFLAGLNDTTGTYADFTTMSLPYAGKTDWRLPTVAELVSLVDYGRSGPAIDPTYFPNAAGAYFWSSETKTNTGTVWTVGFNKGGLLAQIVNAYTVHARAVRGPVLVHDFVDNGDGTITDRGTELMWTKVPISSPEGGYTWQQALEAAERATVAGYDDWRLPSIKEWAFLIDRSRSNPTLPPVFADTMWLTFWTATTESSSPSRAWYVKTDTGVFLPATKSNWMNSLRLVRDIPPSLAAGDVDGSGAVELRDAILLLRVLAGLPLPDGVTIYPQAAADGSGRLGLADIAHIFRLLAGK